MTTKCNARFKTANGQSYKCNSDAQHESDHACRMSIFSASGVEAKVIVTWPWKNNMGWMRIDSEEPKHDH